MKLTVFAKLAVAASLPFLVVAQQSPAPKNIPPTTNLTPPTTWEALKFPALRQIQIPKVEESTLSNGMRIYLLENHELPTLRGLALVRTGNLFDPADKVGLATITGELIRGGGTTTESQATRLTKQLENIAASVESSISESYGSVFVFDA